eukprot:4938440-Prymnesium_polylepis.1
MCRAATSGRIAPISSATLTRARSSLVIRPSATRPLSSSAVVGRSAALTRRTSVDATDASSAGRWPASTITSRADLTDAAAIESASVAQISRSVLSDMRADALAPATDDSIAAGERTAATPIWTESASAYFAAPAVTPNRVAASPVELATT